jgi:hypothetical protein
VAAGRSGGGKLLNCAPFKSLKRQAHHSSQHKAHLSRREYVRILKYELTVKTQSIAKYLKHKTLAQVEEKPTDSPFWKGLMRVKSDFFKRGKFKIGDWSRTRFWEDVWLGDVPLAQQYPSLYNIVQRKNVLVSTVLGQVPINIDFRRSLNEHK